MSNHEETFVKYLDGQLDDEERKRFENLLEIDQEVFSEFEEFKRVKDLFSDDLSPSLENDYLNQIIPEFRKKLEKKNNPAFYRKYELAFTTFFLVVTLYFITEKLFINNDPAFTVSSVVSEFTEEELNEVADYYLDGDWTIVSDNDALALLDNSNLNLEDIAADFSSEDKISIISVYDLSEDYFSVDSELLNAAYDKILEKRFF